MFTWHQFNIEASITSLDCSHGVCPQTQGALTCTITGNVALWYSPPSGRSPIATVSSENFYNGHTGFTAALVTITNPGLTTSLSFTATINKNGTQVMCTDDLNTNSMTIMISIRYVTNSIVYN